MNTSKLFIAAALAASAFAAPAQAAPVAATTNASGRALILVPLTLTKIDDLDFGSVIPSGLSGTVMIHPATGARTFTGGVTGVPSAIGQRAYFGGAGSGNQLVIVSVDAPAQLTNPLSPATPINVLTLLVEGSPVKTINPATKTFFFGVGGIIEVGGNQPEGLYQATFEVTASYL